MKKERKYHKLLSKKINVRKNFYGHNYTNIIHRIIITMKRWVGDCLPGHLSLIVIWINLKDRVDQIFRLKRNMNRTVKKVLLKKIYMWRKIVTLLLQFFGSFDIISIKHINLSPMNCDENDIFHIIINLIT